jgi:Tol biopolymer transport system component
MSLDGGSEGGPQWSPDGREVLFKAFSEDERLSFRAIDVESRRERSLLTFDPPGTGSLPRRGLEAFTLRASPDLSAFVYTGVERGVPNVFLAAAGRPPGRALTTDSEGAAFPVVSPRGDRVAVQLIRGETTQLGLVPIAGGPVTAVTTTRGQTWINSWSPDGRFIAAAVMRNGVWNVASIDTVTGRERLLTGHTTPRVYVRYPDWARTGSRIVFEEAEVTGNIWVSRLGEPAGSLAGIW